MKRVLGIITILFFVAELGYARHSSCEGVFTISVSGWQGHLELKQNGKNLNGTMVFGQDRFSTVTGTCERGQFKFSRYTPSHNSTQYYQGRIFGKGVSKTLNGKWRQSDKNKWHDWSAQISGGGRPCTSTYALVIGRWHAVLDLTSSFGGVSTGTLTMNSNKEQVRVVCQPRLKKIRFKRIFRNIEQTYQADIRKNIEDRFYLQGTVTNKPGKTNNFYSK